MNRAVSLQSIFECYRKHISFITVYIREALPIDGWWFFRGFPYILLRLSGSKTITHIFDPKTIEERRSIADKFLKALRFGVRIYVDDMNDTVNKAYAAWPARLYLIGLDGRVLYAGGLAPFGFRPSRLESAIKQYLR